MYRLIHLQLAAYGAPTSPIIIDCAVGLAEQFDATLHVSSPRLNVKPPSHFLAGAMLARLASEMEARAAATAAALDAHAVASCAKARIKLTIAPVEENWSQQAEVTISGRTSDICVLGLPKDNLDQRFNVEKWLFGAGRPCLFVPNDGASPFSFGPCAIAWDGSASAARAVGDALPL